MTPNEQFARTMRYHASPYAFIPHEDGTFTIFEGHGLRREIGNFSLAALNIFLEGSFLSRLQELETHMLDEQTRAEAGAGLLDELGL